MMLYDETQPKWIWMPVQNQRVNQYVEFYREFEASGPVSAELLVSADTNFIAKINDIVVGTGQFTDFPDSRTFSRMTIADAIKPGKNVLSIMVHYCGADHFSYIPGEPGLWFLLTFGNTVIVSNEQTQYRISPNYHQGLAARITPQLGFTFEYNAGTSGNEGSDFSLHNSIKTSTTSVPVERPLPMLTIQPRCAGTIIAQGVLRRFGAPDMTAAQLIQNDFLSARHYDELFSSSPENFSRTGEFKVTLDPKNLADADGAYIVIDLHHEECGFITLELDSEEGVILDIGIGEHLGDLRVRTSVGKRNFGVRYITGKGHQLFTHYLHRYSGRYIQLHITNLKHQLTLHYAGLLPCDYPLEPKGAFQCSDSLMNRIFEVSGRTMHLCMHEHYEDCPWREQALYAEDARIQALVGYYAFGDYNFARTSINLMGRTLREDGYLELCAPSNFSMTIPFSTMTWIMSVTEYLRFSGDNKGIEHHLPRLKKFLEIHRSCLIDNLLPCPIGKRYWQFYDWASGLDGTNMQLDDGTTSPRFDAPLNLFFVLALNALAELFTVFGEEHQAEICIQQATLTKHAIHDVFWNNHIQAYQTYVGNNAIQSHYAELTQSLALLCHIPEKKLAKELRNRLTQLESGLVGTTLGADIYKFEAILENDDEFAKQVKGRIISDWGKMLFEGATSFWETKKGQKDFSGAGSLCHGYSAIPPYIYQAYFLGIKPDEIGFRTFTVNPLTSALCCAEGNIPTPYGAITVSWEKRGKEIVGELKYPEIIKPIFKTKTIQWQETRYKAKQ
jgi:hypothetical protein